MEGFLLQVALAIFLGLALFFPQFLKLFWFNQEPSNIPNGSMGWPFIGETLSYVSPHKSNSMGSFLEKRCSRYGRVFKSHLLGKPTIVSCDHELNTFILQNEGKLFESGYPKPILDILGKLSILLSTGDLHKKLRSHAVGFISESKSRPEFLCYVEKLSILVMESFKERRHVGFFEEAKKARARLSSTLAHIIKERKKKTGVGNEKGDLFDEMLKKGNLNDEEKVSVAIDFLFGGYETSSGLLALLVYFIALSPCVLDQLKEEHQALRRRKKDGEPLSFEDCKQMEFTSSVISEALRCGNIVKVVYRKALKDTKFKEYAIPQGWQVIPVFTGAHLDPSLHQNPSQFDPSRWADQAINKKVSPFGGGLRQCPGAPIARLETSIFLHHLVLNYRWKIQDDESPMAHPHFGFKRGLLLEIEPAEDKM